MFKRCSLLVPADTESLMESQLLTVVSVCLDGDGDSWTGVLLEDVLSVDFVLCWVCFTWCCWSDFDCCWDWWCMCNCFHNQLLPSSNVVSVDEVTDESLELRLLVCVEQILELGLPWGFCWGKWKMLDRWTMASDSGLMKKEKEAGSAGKER